MTAEQLIEKNVAYYNNRDIEGFISLFSDDIKFYSFSGNDITINGIGECRNFYRQLFDQSPQLHATIVKRICFANKVIDQESITGRAGSADGVFEIVLIYEVKDDKIFKVTAIRQS